MNGLIERYKKIRKKGLLEKKYKGKYAFVGIGNHSLNNLYPVLNYLKVDLKYIVAKSNDTLELIRNNFAGVTATSNLNDVLNDPEIKGVFVSANPVAHFSLAKQILASNKMLFIEKPPCSSLAELNELIVAEQKSKATALTGLQRRYAPMFHILKNKVKEASYYTLKYKTGGYPEGNELLDLFIHPIDAAFFLFGSGKVENVKTIKGKGTYVYLAQIQHQNGVVGSLELSTDYSWTEAKDELVINAPNGEYITENTSKLLFCSKPKVLMNIPLEKVKSFLPQTTTLFQQNNFLPVKDHNQLYSAGYYNEIEAFLQLCESGVVAKNLSGFNQLTATFEALETLSKSKS
ncbi:MAG: Gfo/Idh/MocA family oxidoreductase [Flavobacteriales bacterium]|nr:Gfo/Idh/MocA family oxidoreductase [Flavobacteriales bacterium]HRN41361.1 Gfo/Idh/MocA family oxidoreductase [Vicingus sp.]HRP59350.1 Gfo/Idh/MocA family oxidoreductase [Vicingus sp.]